MDKPAAFGLRSERFSVAMRYTLVVTIAVIIALIATLIFFEKPLSTILANNHLLPEPETFTEVYFENHENLPSRVEAGEKYTFTFSVHSEEQQNMTYPYSIYIQTNTKRIPIKNGNFSLTPNQKKTFKETFIAPSYKNVAKVIVNLNNINQNIDFWINE
jgi:hypothetical protein